jgi:hypothetical protein
MQCEEEEWGLEDDEEAVMADPFIVEGLSSSSDSEGNVAAAVPNRTAHAGKAKREHLKQVLCRAKERRQRHRLRRQREEVGNYSGAE